MAKFLYVLLAILFVCPLIAGVPDEKLHNQCLYPVVLVRPMGVRGCGTGVIVRSTKVAEGEYQNVFVTCAHVSLAYDQSYVVQHFSYEKWSHLTGSKTYPVEWVHHDPVRDLAIGVFVSDVKMPVSEIDFDPSLYIGSDVYRIGCGLGDEPRLDYGKVTSVKTSLGNIRDVVRTSIHTLPGDSGSPVFHEYKVFGIMQAIRQFQHGFGNQPVFNMSYCVPLARLKIMDEEQGHTLQFAWTTKKMPGMPFWKLKFKAQYEVVTK
jgi:S1-C subfamily serine protease